jgi:hypothetical protein
LQGVTDSVDVVFVHLNHGKRAIQFPIKRTTSCGDCINYCVQRLLLVEVARHLYLVSVDPKGQSTEIPDFKQLYNVKFSHPNNRFVLCAKPGAPRNVSESLDAINEEAEKEKEEK